MCEKEREEFHVMKRSKTGRLTALVMAVILILSLVACASDSAPSGGDSTPASNAPSEQPSTAAPTAEGDKVISMWEIQTEQPVDAIIQDSIDRFEAANPDFKVDKNVLQNEDYKSKIVVAIGSDTAPDIFITWTGGGMIEYINANRIIPLTKYMEQDNFKDYFMDAGIAQATYDGDIWCVPLEGCSVAGIYYNKRTFSDLGITVPDTLDELETAMDKMVANGVIPFGLANKAKYVASFYYMYLVDRYAGPEVFANAANRKNGGSFEDEAFLWAGQKISDWARKGYFGEGYNSLDGETLVHHQMFYNGECAMLLDGSWAVSQYYTEEGPVEDISLFPFPRVEGGKGDINNLVGTVGDTFYVISSGAVYPDQCFEFLKYMIDDTAVQKRIEVGRVPPTKNATAGNELNKVVLDMLQKAPSIQLWYDQYLPSDMAEIHKDQLQALVGLSITPEEYNAAMEAAAVTSLGPAA